MGSTGENPPGRVKASYQDECRYHVDNLTKLPCQHSRYESRRKQGRIQRRVKVFFIRMNLLSESSPAGPTGMVGTEVVEACTHRGRNRETYP